MSKPLNFRILAECSVTKARSSILTLLHGDVLTPVFMPVGTKGTVKSVLNEQLIKMNCQILLGNTYHLGTSPGIEVLEKAGGLHKFMSWDRNILTDSGGFQMVSLLKLAEIKEEGVNFTSPYDSSKQCLMTPEHSIEIQNIIGGDIIMQLDDVVKTTTVGPRVQEAMERTTRWLDRCIKAHKNPNKQNIFPIVQGALDGNLRTISAQNHTKRNVNGYAIGGLSGGESKDDFWKMVSLSTNILPKDKPRYLMGVGFAVDMVICVALGIDMFDCVFPTRTARFGCALVKTGQINLKKAIYENDLSPIDVECSCSTCLNYSRAYLHGSFSLNPVSCHLITIHNLYYQFELMKNIRMNIENGTFDEFIQNFMLDFYSNGEYPQWVIDSLKSVNITLKR